MINTMGPVAAEDDAFAANTVNPQSLHNGIFSKSLRPDDVDEEGAEKVE